MLDPDLDEMNADPKPWQRYIKISIRLILLVCDVIFWYAGKTHNGEISRVFLRGPRLFDPQIVLSAKTVNVPLILIKREALFFMQAKHIIGDFEKTSRNRRLCVMPA